MNAQILFKLSFSGILSLIFIWLVYSRNADEEHTVWGTGQPTQKYRPYIGGGLLPGFMLGIVLLCLATNGRAVTAKMMLTICFDIFLSISVYFVFLLLFLPVLRKKISARACAMLWLIPNYLYVVSASYMQVPKPLVILHASSLLVKILSSVWAAGFLAVFFWKLTAHLLFRRRLLKNAVPVSDAGILEVFREELDAASVKKPNFRLVTTDDISTPLTIGLFRLSMRIVLPRRQYTSDELRLILRHELIHLGREDNWAKFFLIFCTAMRWFNPLMWIAMKKSAEDIELSCDETVLLDADTKTRGQYARLILDTAGDDNGFSTCLSASASAMRYRLKSIVKPAVKRSGALTVGIVFFVLCMSSGHIALAYGEATGKTTVFRDCDTDSYRIILISVNGGEFQEIEDDTDLKDLTEYIAGLHTQEMTGSYNYPDKNDTLSVWYDSPYGPVIVDLGNDVLKVLYLNDRKQSWNVYHLPEPVDWEIPLP